MECPKCGKDTFNDLSGVGSKLLGESYKCSNPKCGHTKITANQDGKTLSDFMKKKKKE